MSLQIEVINERLKPGSPSYFYARGRQIEEERQLDRHFNEAQERHRTNTGKLFSLICTSGIDPRVHESIYQAIFAPTSEYLPTSWPASLPSFDIEEYGEVYNNPESLILSDKDYNFIFDRLLRASSGSITDLVLEYAPALKEQDEEDAASHRWTKEGYQDIIFQLLKYDFNPERVQALFQHFDIRGSNSEITYKPLRDLYNVLKTNSKSEDWLRREASSQMHRSIIQEEMEGSSPQNSDERALPIYKDIIINLSKSVINAPAYIRDDYRKAREEGHSHKLRDFILGEFEWILSMSPSGPVFDLPVFKKVFERFAWQSGYVYYEDDERCRNVLMESLQRQVLPVEGYKGFTIETDEDEHFVDKELFGRWYFNRSKRNIYNDLPTTVRAHLEEELMSYRTKKALGDKPFADEPAQSETLPKADLPYLSIAFPRGELDNTGEPTKRI